MDAPPVKVVVTDWLCAQIDEQRCLVGERFGVMPCFTVLCNRGRRCVVLASLSFPNSARASLNSCVRCTQLWKGPITRALLAQSRTGFRCCNVWFEEAGVHTCSWNINGPTCYTGMCSMFELCVIITEGPKRRFAESPLFSCLAFGAQRP